MSNRQQSSPQKLSNILEESITSLLTTTPDDAIEFLANYFKQQPHSPNEAYYKLSQIHYKHANFPDYCYQVYCQYREIILDHIGTSKDHFLTELYTNISNDIPIETAKILTSKLQLTPPTDFKSFENNIRTCYTFKSYISTADKLYSHLLAGKEFPPQETMLEAIDVLKGQLVMLRRISDSNKHELISYIQELVLDNAGNSVSREEFVRMLALLFVYTI
ncbi:hypothetical protein LOD99_12291 [Oopsacas minuta]|uniref:RIIa domain-containing protein n=1 Tax=Oopsacas minuta TaxID=111878 RepID=A0AAV7JES1_9METZ|nr:hypothetical protein LOD99_12291 [Oopsacas minuta]